MNKILCKEYHDILGKLNFAMVLLKVITKFLKFINKLYFKIKVLWRNNYYFLISN